MASLKLKNNDILKIQLIFNHTIPKYLAQTPGAEINTRFSFLINYNTIAFEPIIKLLSNATKTKIPEYEMYENERKAMIERYCKKDVTPGTPRGKIKY
jgi:CBS domain containing-hemolysin-like protein